jgi:DNA polymerase-4
VGRDALRRKLLSQATRVADRLAAKDIWGRKVQLKIRDTDFRTETRQCTLAEPTREAKVIYDAVCRLLEEVELRGRRFRLTGVGVGQLVDGVAPQQLDLLVAVRGAAQVRAPGAVPRGRGQQRARRLGGRVHEVGRRGRVIAPGESRRP